MTPEYQKQYNERLAELEKIYAPQITGLQEQITTLPQMYEAQKSALQQAKENAFRDITKTAARGGMFFTGFTPREQARYLGERYLPGLQTLSQQELAARQGLLGQITNIQGQQRAAGLSYLDQLRAQQRADEQARLAREEAAKTRAAAAGAGGFDFASLAAALGQSGATTDTTKASVTTTPTLDPVFAEIRGTIQSANVKDILKDINNQIFIADRSTISSPEAKELAANRLKTYAGILKNFSRPGLNLTAIPVKYGGSTTVKTTWTPTPAKPNYLATQAQNVLGVRSIF